MLRKVLRNFVITGSCWSCPEYRLWAFLWLVPGIMNLLACLLITCCTDTTSFSSPMSVSSTFNTSGFTIMIASDRPNSNPVLNQLFNLWAYTWLLNRQGCLVKPTAEGGGIHTSSM